MRESNYWLEMLGQTTDISDRPVELDELIDESDQLKRIPGAICRKKSSPLNN